MRGVIYKYTSPSNKIYIGQTLNEYMRRAMWKNIKHPYAGVYINRARKKYGYNSFRYEVNIVDYYWNIPISTDNLIRIHNILAGITLFIVLILYVKSNKVIIRKNNK